MPDLGEAELRVVLTLIRQTAGYQRNKVSLTIAMLQGLTGLAYNGVMNGVKAAENRGIIIRERGNGTAKTSWRIIQPAQSGGLDLHKVEVQPPQSGGQNEAIPARSEGVDLHEVKDIKKKKEIIIIDDDPSFIPDTKLGDIERAIVEYTKLPVFSGGAIQWTECIKRLAKAEVTPDDIKSAVKVLSDKGYKITRAGSIENTAISLAAQRKRTNEKTDNMQPLEGAFYG